MTIQDLIQRATEHIPVSELSMLASDRSAFGDDVLAALKSQAQLRTKEGDRILREGKADERGQLLASEAREFDSALRERDAILGLIAAVERRTSERAHVPATQPTIMTRTTDAGDEPAIVPAVVTREQPLSTWLQQRGGFAYQGERGAERMRLGAIVRGMIGHRSGLTPMELRALSEGTDSAGGYTVPEVLAARFLDRVRNAAVVMRAGALTVPMTSDTLHLARLGQPDSVSPAITGPSWKAENAEIDEYDMVLERVTFQARTLPILITLSVELSEDSSNIDQIIETELSRALALELDRAALLGSGTAPEPRGIRNQSGVNVTSFASATPTDYDFLVDAIGRVWANNHEPNARIYNADLATTLAKLKDSTGQPLRAPEAVAGVTAFRTNQIANDGTSPDTTSVFIGDFSQLMIGLRTSFRLEASRVASTAFSKLQIAIRSYLRADVQLAHPEAFDVTRLVGI